MNTSFSSKFANWIIGLAIAALVAILGVSGFVFLNSNSTTSLPGPTSYSKTVGKCEIESCHGLNVTCGAKGAEVCTEQYQLGDKCRQYLSCQTIKGSCQLVKDSKFEACKSCVEKCEVNISDVQSAFECESKCN